MDLKLILICSIICLVIHQIGGVKWDYGKYGPGVWKKYYPKCAGEIQSPINIKTACTIYQKFEPFQFTSNHNKKLSFILKNDGHTIVGKTNESDLSITGGNLNGTFQFVNFHIHWGSNENEGSEHQVNGEKSAGEAHFFYTNYKTNQSAVLAFLMESQWNSSDQTIMNNSLSSNATMAEWTHYFDISEHLASENDTDSISLNLRVLMGSNVNDFWRYTGSLTIPPCADGIIWTIFEHPIFILDYHFDTYRQGLFFQSYRGPQPLYKRTVYQSFPNRILSSVPDENCCTNSGSNAKYFFSKQITFIYFSSTLYFTFSFVHW